jgi:hypothetical protein
MFDEITPAAAEPSGSVAWVVPTHPPHFPFAVELLRGVSDHRVDVDVHFVVGDRAEADGLAELLPTGGRHSLIVAEERLAPGRLSSYLAVGSIINAKKFVGLHALLDRYDMLCTLDSETAVLRPGDVRGSYALRRERSAYPAHAVDAPLMRRIVQATARLFGLGAEDRIIREVTAGGRLYAWFEDVPVYESDTLAEMFERLGADRDLTVLCDRLSWFDFDHILYQYFCCLFGGWQLEDLGWPAPERTGAWWEIWRSDVAADRELAAAFASRWAPSWVSDPGLLDLFPSAFLAFHRDRLADDEVDAAAPETALQPVS